MLIFFLKKKILDKKENLTHKLLYITKKRPSQTLISIFLWQHTFLYSLGNMVEHNDKYQVIIFYFGPYYS